ncbi:p23 chaperone protein wos2 [Coemansia sp. RSA 1933]|nr:p23 chaperone protein wos2 [Coemansia sp. RSA 1933]
MTSSILHPPVLWAQREDIVFLTIDLHDAKDAQIELKEQSISFKNTTDGNEYAFHLDFYKPIKPDEGKKSATGRKVVLILDKAEGEWWPRLTKESQKPNFLKTDFDHWKDSDDSEDETPNQPGGMDFSQMGMGGMGGMMGGMGGMGGMMGGMPGLEGLANMGGMGGGMPDLSALGGGPDADEEDDEEEEEKGAATVEAESKSS